MYLYIYNTPGSSTMYYVPFDGTVIYVHKIGTEIDTCFKLVTGA